MLRGAVVSQMGWWWEGAPGETPEAQESDPRGQVVVMGMVGRGGAGEGSLVGLSRQSRLWLRGCETEGVESAAPRRRTQQARSIRFQVEPTGPVPLPQMRRQGAVWVGDLHAEVSPQGQLQNEEEAGSHQGSPRVAL